jgi:hypothetical protein
MRPLLLIIALLATACSSLPRQGGPGDPDSLLQEEIRASGARNAYELVERLRPRWLRAGPPRSTRLDTVILVYFNGTALGGPETLRDIALEQVHRMRVLDSAEAGQLPGLGSRHVERVIMVETAPGR